MATSAALGGPFGLSYRGPSPIAIGRALGVFAAAMGVIVLGGWLLRIEALTSFAPGAVPMKANTALGLVLSGGALLLTSIDGTSWARPLRMALGAAVLALGLLTLAEYGFGWRLSVDELFTHQPIGSTSAEFAGRPSPIAALNFVLLGAALLAVDAGNAWRVRPAEALGLAMGLLTFISLQGYIFGEASLYQVPAFSTVGLHTAVAFVALSTGVFVMRPTVGLMSSITADGIGGATLRRLLPISLIVPLAVSWVRLQGERFGYFDATTGMALVVTAMVACLMLLAFVSIAPLAAVEARNRAAEQVAGERIRRLNRVYAVLSHINHAIVRERNLSALLDRTCRIAVDEGGFAAAWIALAPGSPSGTLQIAADAGPSGHAAALRATVADQAFASSAPARAIAENRLVIANGDEAAERQLTECPPLAALAATHGYQAVACFPLRSGDLVRGVLVLGSADPALFDADEVRLLAELAMDVGFAMDVSRSEAERSQATTALRESQVRLERAVRAGNVGLWEWSLVTSTVYYSSQWKRQLGCDDDEIAPDFEAWRSRIHPEDVERAIATISDYLRGRAPHLELEYRCRHKDGSYRHMLAHATVLLDDRGTQVALLGAHVDVTHHTELQAQFLQSQKMESLGRLAGGIAHDFNNLLTIINGTADLALLRLAAVGQRDDDWRGVRDAGERAATLTRQLLAISRKQVVQIEVLDPNEVLGGIEGMLRRLIGEDVLLRVALAPDAGRVKADAGQIEQVVVNLAVNARDAMPCGGILTLETRAADVVGTMMAAERSPIGQGRYVVIAVTDTGEGMDEATQARAFEPFFTTKAPGKGTGLGLSTVFGIVRQCGGAIRLRSERGAGTTFEVYLPSVDDPARRARSGPHQTVVRGTETILVVEDEPALRMVARKILENAGYTVMVASSGDEALTVFRRAVTPIHLLLTDVVMPGMSGPTLVGRVREEGGRTNILYTSGYADDALTSESGRDERIHFLAKPYTGTTLLRKIRDVLDTKASAAGG